MMKIQFLNGGLANQVFQYIFMRYAELSSPSGEKWFLDDSYFFTTKIHNGYELEKVFGIKPQLLSQTFDADVWEEFLKNKKNGISVPQTFKNLGFDMIMYAETDNYPQMNPFDGDIYRLVHSGQFDATIPHINYPNVYYHGYWINKNWLHAYKDIILKELSFPEMTNPNAIKYANQIMSGPSLSMHVRRGDYVTLGFDAKPEVYKTALEEIKKVYHGFTVYVFSDDLNWCQEHTAELGLDDVSKVVYVSGNTGENSYLDMQLMSMCEGSIVGNSAFCYLAALMNQRLKVYMNLTKREI